jgi:thioredoxin reductase (NADPH)
MNWLMKKPIIFALDDDPQVLKAVQNDLRQQYRKEYRIMATDSVADAIEAVEKLKAKGENIALFLSDQRMPEMLGVEFLEKASSYFPKAKRVLLTAYSDINAAIKAINDVQLDFYLLKPWSPPEEKLYPMLNDLLDAWQGDHIPDFSGIRVIGHQWSAHSHRIKDFLSANMIPYQWLDIEQDESAKTLLKTIDGNEEALPVVFLPDGDHLLKPSLSDLGSKAGLSTRAKEEIYDVAIIGAGPAGLAAAVYGGSEGLKTIMIEKRAPGGQAGTSSRIENYLGFPKGLSGSELARRAITQATRFGIEFLSPLSVEKIELENQYKILTLSDDSKINARSVVITTGVDYRKHPAENVDRLTGAGVYYGAANTEANACAEKDVYVVGGGNSAGQAAVYLSRFARRVFITIRRENLQATMSSYLIDQIDEIDNIVLLPKSNILKVNGEQNLQSLTLQHIETSKVEEREAGALFIFIGARPYTDWLPESIIKNDKGYVETGTYLKPIEGYARFWKKPRDPFILETSVPGIFAAGDVRSGAMNRVASAVGEGAMAIKFVHEYLAET